MADKVKGLTIELESDVTGVKKAFKELKADSRQVETQLKDVNKALKFDPKNTTLLEQKQKLLAQAVGKTADQLEAAKSAQAAFVQSGGDIDSSQYSQLVIETERLSGHLSDLESQSAECAAALEDTGDAAANGADGVNEMSDAEENAASSSERWEVALGNLISNGIQKLAGAMTDAISSTMTLADDVATLANNYGISQEAAYTLYKNQGLLDYSVSSVTKGIKEQYEALADGSEAYDELGIATKDANGKLLSQEDIWLNTIEYLRAIKDPVERAAHGTELLGNKYYDLGGILNSTDEDFNAFRESMLSTDEELQRDIEGMNKANDAIDRLKNVMTDMAIGLGDVVGFFAELDGLLPTIAVVITGITAAWLAFGGAATVAAAAQTALNVVLAANPLGLIILAITAVIAGLVLLWNNCEGFRNMLTDLGNTIVEWATKITELGKTIGTNFFNAITEGFNKVKDWISGFWNWLTGLFSSPVNVNVNGSSNIDGSHANGLDYVPFDGYIAQLHKGERVLTAGENRAFSGGAGSGAVTIVQNIQSVAQTPIELAAASRMYYNLAMW